MRWCDYLIQLIPDALTQEKAWLIWLQSIFHQAPTLHTLRTWPSWVLSSTYPATPHMPPTTHTMVRIANRARTSDAEGLRHSQQDCAADPPILFPVFAGKDASRALAQSSLKPEECRPEWEDLPDKEKGVLRDWFTFFSKRYNIVGKVQQ